MINVVVNRIQNTITVEVPHANGEIEVREFDLDAVDYQFDSLHTDRFIVERKRGICCVTNDYIYNLPASSVCIFYINETPISPIND